MFSLQLAAMLMVVGLRVYCCFPGKTGRSTINLKIENWTSYLRTWLEDLRGAGIIHQTLVDLPTFALPRPWSHHWTLAANEHPDLPAM